MAGKTLLYEKQSISEVFQFDTVLKALGLIGYSAGSEELKLYTMLSYLIVVRAVSLTSSSS